MAPQDPLPQQPPHIGPVVEDRSKHERFTPHALAIVLSHFDIGVITTLRQYLRGSRMAPKLQIKTDRGVFLLKRRAPGHDDPSRVAFSHCLQERLAECHYPVPQLIRTRHDATMVQHDDRVYEMFEFVVGLRYDKSSEATVRSGAALGGLHRLLADFRPPHEPPFGTYHDAADVGPTFRRLPRAVAAVEADADADELSRSVRFLQEAYRDAAARVEECMDGGWDRTVLHGDWHPGNLLFRDGTVVAVLDFDSARIEPRMIDVANGALQFSMEMSDANDPGKWPEGLDIARIRSFLAGYDSAATSPLASGERAAVPWLIIEALIIESIVPIAATGRFAHMPGSAFLAMVQRKVQWLRPRARKLVEFLERSEV